MNNNPRKVLSFIQEPIQKTNPTLQLKILKYPRKLFGEKGEIE